MPLGFERLVAWQRADDLFIAVHGAAMSFPLYERFALASQLRRAAFSVPANIVEGMTRRRSGDRLRFLNIAEASLAETAYCLHAARRLGYLSDAQYTPLDKAVRQTAAPLVGLIRQIAGEAAPRA
ncbi:MAG: four helix bundle protein [Vicinamibacterales bacterium]